MRRTGRSRRSAARWWRLQVRKEVRRPSGRWRVAASHGVSSQLASSARSPVCAHFMGSALSADSGYVPRRTGSVAWQNATGDCDVQICHTVAVGLGFRPCPRAAAGAGANTAGAGAGEHERGHPVHEVHAAQRPDADRPRGHQGAGRPFQHLVPRRLEERAARPVRLRAPVRAPDVSGQRELQRRLLQGHPPGRGDRARTAAPAPTGPTTTRRSRRKRSTRSSGSNPIAWATSSAR